LPHAKPLVESNVFSEAALLNTPLWAVIIDKGGEIDDARLSKPFIHLS